MALILKQIKDSIGIITLNNPRRKNALSEIDCAASKITVQGERYPEELMRMTGR